METAIHRPPPQQRVTETDRPKTSRQSRTPSRPHSISWNAKDVPGLVAAFTDEGLVATIGEPGATAAEVQAGLPEFIGEPPISDAEFSNTSVDGDTASTDVQSTLGNTLMAESYELVKQGDAWLISGQEDGEVEVPDGTTEVNVDLNEFAFGLRTTDITDATGPIALVGNNVGEQEHEMGLARIPADANLDELLRTEEDVPGFEFIGGVGPIEPGDTASLVLTAPLEAGRYVLVCFLPDTAEGSDGEPHAYKGMVSDLTVE